MTTTAIPVTDAEYDLGDVEVSVPLDADKPLLIEAGGTGTEISLPAELRVRDGVLADDGTVVFEEAGDGAHAAVQALDDGSVRLQTVLDSPDAPSTYTYDFGQGVELVLLENGSVEVTEPLGDGIVAVTGTIDAPWAIDADGASVPTSYTVDGSRLVQHVEHGPQHTYPITADPSYSYGWKVYTKYSRSETRNIAGWTSYGTIVSGVCPFIPRFGQVTAAACIAAFSAVATSIDNTFNSAKSQGRCVEISYPYYPTLVTIAAQARWKVVSC
ncbi:hypothetical protein [Demequina activiva]|nr:hypothetical protein [Demequina activiva]